MDTQRSLIFSSYLVRATCGKGFPLTVNQHSHSLEALIQNWDRFAIGKIFQISKVADFKSRLFRIVLDSRCSNPTGSSNDVELINQEHILPNWSYSLATKNVWMQWGLISSKKILNFRIKATHRDPPPQNQVSSVIVATKPPSPRATNNARAHPSQSNDREKSKHPSQPTALSGVHRKSSINLVPVAATAAHLCRSSSSLLSHPLLFRANLSLFLDSIFARL